ncbi:MAG TPA: fatty acid desaturase [Fimbriiglobus sp.]|nr:fatty acid desaturase [Fimbriiglobus sp.]
MGNHDKALLAEAHRARWGTFRVWLGFVAALFAAEAVLAWEVVNEFLLLAIPTTVLVAHLMHSQLLAFHEAAHGVLCPNRAANELVGLLVGKFHFNGLSLFRAVHHTHHAHLGTERDEQLWPFNDPRVPRWRRRLAALCELTFGVVYDAVEFWRAFLRKDSQVRNPRVRRRVWLELGLIVAFWGTVVGATAYFGAWKWLVVLYVLPACAAGNMHSLRKYTEHMGMTGSTVLGLTRTVVPAGPLGRLLSFTLFNVNYHGVHHYYAAMPQRSLSRFAEDLRPGAPGEETIYPSYRAAFRAMLPSLADPRVGPQWVRTPEAPRAAPRVTPVS